MSEVQEGGMQERKRREFKLEVDVTSSSPVAAPIELLERLSRPLLSPRTLSVDEKLQTAERRRQEFKTWLTSRRRSHATKQLHRETREEQRLHHQTAKLQERHEQAASSYAAQLEQRRSRATRLLSRRAAALARLEARQQQESEGRLRLQEQQETADQRRRLLQDLERERLKQEHLLVLTRLNMHREDDASREQQRRRLEERLSLAEQAREQMLGLRATRAGAKVARARRQGSQARALQQQKAEVRRGLLEERLRLAELRRQAALPSPRSLRSPGAGVPSPPQLPEPASTADTSPADTAKPDPEPEAAAAATTQEEPSLQQQQEVAELYARVEGLRRHVSCRKLQQCWRAFVRKHRTTRSLATALAATGITGVALPAATQPPAPQDVPAPPQQQQAASAPIAIVGGLSPRSSSPRGLDRFDQFAAAMRDPAALKAAQMLLRRLERRLAGCGLPVPSCASLLLRLFPKSAAYQEEARQAARRGGAAAWRQAGGSAAVAAAGGDRYPARVFLTAWMVVRYPEVVFNAMGTREVQLAERAARLVAVFESLLHELVHAGAEPAGAAGAVEPGTSPAPLPPSPLLTGVRLLRMGLHPAPERSGGAAGAASPSSASLGSTAALLVHFDEVWVHYLDQFVVWKTEDAASLEAELVRMAAQMERSLRRKLASPPPGGAEGRRRAAQDLAAMEEQVARDHGLLRERVARLAGAAGLERLDAALAAAREEAAAAGGAASTDVSASEPDSDGGSAAGARRIPRLDGRKAPTATGSASTAAAAAAEQLPAPAPKATGITRGFFNSAKRPASPPARASAAPPAALPSPAAAPSPRPTALTPEAMANLVMVNDLLHQPRKRLPTEEVDASLRALLEQDVSSAPPAAAGSGDGGAGGSFLLDPAEVEGLAPDVVVAMLRARAREVTERAFWDSVEARVLLGLKSGSLLLAAAPLAAEVGRELAALVSEPQLAAQLSREFGSADASDAELVERLEDAARQAVAEAEAAAGAGGRASKAAAAAAAAAALLPGSLPGLLLLLERLGSLLVEYGAPERRAPYEEAQQSIRQELTAALTALALAAQAKGAAPGPPVIEASPAEARGLARSLSRAMRLLHLQMKQLKLDAANARLGALSQQLGGSTGVQYVRDKFRKLHRLEGAAVSDSEPSSGAGLEPPAPTQLAAALPKTWAWLLTAAAAAPAMQRYCREALGMDLDAAVAAAQQQQRAAGPVAPAGGGAPTEIRTGRSVVGRASGGGAAAEPPPPLPRPEVVARTPVSLLSPAGLVRAGLVSLVSGGAPAVGPALAEALALDAERLHGLQNQFQSLVVVAASFLLVQQLRAQHHGRAAAVAAAAGAVGAVDAAAPPPPPAAWDRAAAKLRLQVLLADPSLQMQHLVSELTRMTGVSQSGLQAEEQDRAAAQLKAALLRVVDPAGAAFRSLSNGLAAALLLYLLVGPSGAGEAESGALISRLLGRVGAGILEQDVLQLAAALLALTGVNEGVHAEGVYEPLCGLALEQQRQAQSAAVGAAQASNSEVAPVASASS